MNSFYAHVRPLHDAMVALDDLGYVIERLETTTLAIVLQTCTSNDLKALEMALEMLREAVEWEALRREEAVHSNNL